MVKVFTSDAILVRVNGEGGSAAGHSDCCCLETGQLLLDGTSELVRL